MTGLTGDEMDDWRSKVADALYPAFVCLSPLRDKPFLFKPGKKLGPQTYDHNCYWAQPGNFSARDEHDIRNADVVLMNLLVEDPISLGTMCELGMARGLHKPIVAVIRPDGVYDKSLPPEWATFLTCDLDRAIEVVRSLFAK
jgi:nucleoside 2-deoxyribosyltransferase